MRNKIEEAIKEATVVEDDIGIVDETLAVDYVEEAMKKYVGKILRELMFKSTKSWPARGKNSQIKKLAEREGIQIPEE